MKINKTISAIAGAGVLGLSMSFTAPAFAGGVLKSAVNDWTGGAVMCEIVHQIAERELGYKVKRITMPSGPGRTKQFVQVIWTTAVNFGHHIQRLFRNT
ncbi:MAG: hypothetical protein AAFW66_09940 [Pseudomonadota bacterium]